MRFSVNILLCGIIFSASMPLNALKKNPISSGMAFALLAEEKIDTLKEYFERDKIYPPILNVDLQNAAKKYGYTDFVAWLIEKDEIRKDLEFRLPYALKTLNEKELKRFIILNTLSLNYRDNNGNSLLHIAAQKSAAQFCLWLIKMGLPVNIKNDAGKYPIELNTKEVEPIERIFVENGAKIRLSTEEISGMLNGTITLNTPITMGQFSLYGYQFNSSKRQWTRPGNKTKLMIDFFTKNDISERLYRFKLALMLGSEDFLHDLFEHLKYNESSRNCLFSALQKAFDGSWGKNDGSPFDFLNPHFHPGENSTPQTICKQLHLPDPENILWMFAYFADILVNNQPKITGELIHWVRADPAAKSSPKLLNYLVDIERSYPGKYRIRHNLGNIFVTADFVAKSKKNLCDFKIICKK